MIEESVDVVVASIPQGISHEVRSWLLSLYAGGTTLSVFGQRISVINVVRDNEFVVAWLDGSVFVVSCYVSTHPAIAHFKGFLQKLEDTVLLVWATERRFLLLVILMHGLLLRTTGNRTPEGTSLPPTRLTCDYKQSR